MQGRNIKKFLEQFRVIIVTIVYFLTLLASSSALLYLKSEKASAATDVFRLTSYELQSGEYTSTGYSLTLNNNLSSNYFVMISGPSEATGSRAVNEDQVRVVGDPFGNFGSTSATNELELNRGSASNDWIGIITVVECMVECSTMGFELSEVLETSLPAGSADALQTVNDNLASSYTSNTVPLGGHYGGGIDSAGSDANSYATTLGVKITKTGSNQLQFERYGAESRAPAAATITTYVTEWGSEWNVQDVNVTGTNAGSGVDSTSEYNTASVSSVTRNNTFVWGAGYAYDDGLGDGALGQVVTLGDGVNLNATETSVAVGAEGAQISPGRNFQVYVIEHPNLAVDYRFRVRGDQGAASGYQELTQTVNTANGTEGYDNSSTDVQYTEGYRTALFYSTSGGTGQAYSRTGAWSLRHISSTDLTFYRAYAGQPISGWIQSIDFAAFEFSNVDTRQQIFRWRDDSTDVNSSGGWLAAEDTNLTEQAKNTNLRLRFRVANHGTTPEDGARQYELEFAHKNDTSCDLVSGWSGVSDSTIDEFELYNSAQISPDGELLTGNLLSDPDGFSFVTGEAREVADTTNAIGPLAASAYTELEYALRPTDNAVTGQTYCLRLYDAANSTDLEAYSVYPEITIQSTEVNTTGLGEAGTFTAPANGGWTTVNFAGSYSAPVVVGLSNSHNGESALVFESRNVTTTSADMRLCESEGSTSNGCDTHSTETGGYMVIDASIAAVTDGIEAGTFTANGQADSNSVVTNYSESFSAAPYVFANVNTVTSSEFPIEVVISATSVASFTAGICDHLQGSVDACDGSHGNESVGWVAIEPGNEPFQEQFDSGIENIGNGLWTPVSFSPSFSSTPVLLSASQTDLGGQDVEIDEGRNVSTTGAEIRPCEIDTLDTCDNHNADDVAWFAIEAGQFLNTTEIDQDGFRFYVNENSATPSTPAEDENTELTGVDNGDVIHIRIANQVGASPLAADAAAFKLQYAQASNCSAAGSWNDVGGLGSGVIWRGFNNAAPADGSALPSSLLDSTTNTAQTYEEANNSVGNPSQIASGDRGEWGWIVQNNGASNFTSYCFRMTLSDGSAFNYARYPKLTTSSGVVNLSPNSPANLDQERLSTTQISTGETINETDVVFTSDISDQNANDIVQLCVEVKEIGQAFVNNEDACGSAETYTGAAVPASVTVSGFEHAKSYHWQARVKDAADAYSGWSSFGGNAEIDSDFEIDTVAPSGVVYDGNAAGVDIEFNAGELDELEANWEQVDGKTPDEVSGLVLWLDGDDVENDGTDPANGSSVALWSDRSGLGNDIGGTGAATFDATLQAISFTDDPLPFDDNFDRSGGNSSAHNIYSVVRGNAGTGTNHVWYETTTPRVAPAENGILGGATALSGNNFWSNHITDTKVLTLEYGSGGTSTAWLDRTQEYQFSETQNFADSQRIVIGDDTTGGNRLEAGEYVHEIIVFNQDVTSGDRNDLWEHLECKWQIRDCSVTYDYSIGTSPGGIDILGWTASGASTSASASGLSLTTGTQYYFNVRITDTAGNQTIVSSDGQQVAPSLSFSTSTGGSGITFENLNSSNSFTDTETTIVSTSTNAHNGYEVRSYTSGSLENALLDTIGGFDGGTYAATDTWESGDTGFGYTSSDVLVDGVNRFNASTCPGGGSGGPCFAPFSLTAPGDIVADNDGIISGSPVVNEQFTITHRVTTDEFQPIGTYQTTLIFQAIAKY